MPDTTPHSQLGPNPNDKAPMKGFPQVGFLKNFITHENIIVGNYTYYDDPAGPERSGRDREYILTVLS